MKSEHSKSKSQPRPRPPRAASPTPHYEDSFARVAPFYDQLMENIPYADWVDYIEKVMKVYGRKPTAILDVACGTGTIATLLAQRGYQVVGTDFSEPMLAVARKKAADAGLEVPFFCQDAANLKLKGKFDLALCLYDSLNYILQTEGLLSAFRSIRRVLRPGGYLLFDLNSLYSFHAELFTQESPPGAAVGYRWQSHFDAESCISEVEMFFQPPEGEPFMIMHYQRAYLVEEVVKALRRARFEVVQLFEAYTLLPPGRLSERIFYLAKKPVQEKKTAP